MKHIYILTIALLGFTSAQDTLYTDAIFLALRSQEGIHLDSTLAFEYQYALNQAYEIEDSMQYVHVFPPYQMSTLLVAVDTSWYIPWLDGNLLTGDAYLDSLGNEYGLIGVHHLTWWEFSTNLFKITFDAPAEMWQLGHVFQVHEDIAFAEPNGSGGDGDDIIGFQKNDSTYLAFSIGRGDCPAGCTYRYNWMIRSSENDAMLYWEGDNFEDIPIWDIVNQRWESFGYDWGYYCFVYFEESAIIYSTLLYSPKWWERLYAAEVLWRFYIEDNMWCGRYEENNDQWQMIKDQLENQYDASITVLLTALNDPDSDVAHSAQRALDMLGYVSTESETIIPNSVQLYPVYPNPFNPTTTIRFSVETQRATSLHIFDITGRVVETLVDGMVEPGNHEIQWNASSHPSGIYFAKMISGDFTQTQKLILLK